MQNQGNFAPAVDQRLKEMGTGAERVVTNPTVPDSQARKPVQEFTEFIEQPKVNQPTQYITEQRVREQQEAPIRLKEQQIKQVEQKTVVQEQPVVIKKQEVQVEKERPIEVVKHTTEHQTLPAIEKKEVIVQPVEHTGEGYRTINKTSTESGKPVQYDVKAEHTAAGKISSGSSHKHEIVDQIKESVGGAKVAAHGLIETAREKAREVFHRHDDKTKTSELNTTSSTGTTSSKLNTGTTATGSSTYPAGTTSSSNYPTGNM